MTYGIFKNKVIKKLNKCINFMKFTFEISDNLVTYLDLQIYKGERFLKHGFLDHRINMKKTETHQCMAHAGHL